MGSWRGPDQVRQLGDIRRDPPRLIAHVSVLYKTVDADMRVKAAFEHGTFNRLKIARKGSMLLQFSISGKIAMQRYARLANRFSAGQSMLPEDSYQ